MIIYINTKDQQYISVVLKEKRKVVGSLSAENKYGSQVLLSLIMKLLKNYTPQVPTKTHPKGANLNLRNLLQKLEGIEVEIGPGSFTGLRVGVSVANALGFTLGLPVNGKKTEDNLIY